MKEQFKEIRLGEKALATIAQANIIIAEYQAQGYELTLRQLYYQFVARGLMENTIRQYQRLSTVLSDGRLAGLVDWDAIVDRTRNLMRNPHWDGSKEFLNSVIPQFGMDKWVGQENRVEVWVEKDALIGVLERVCRQNDVSYFATRGYGSQSEMWEAGNRLKRYIDAGQTPVIIHLGDHDPSGVDMTRDLEERMEMFCGETIHVDRIALNMNQIETFNPPENPAKITDPRAKGYIKRFGKKSWELDALDPKTLHNLIDRTIKKYRDHDVWDDNVMAETKQRNQLVAAAKKLKGE